MENQSQLFAELVESRNKYQKAVVTEDQTHTGLRCPFSLLCGVRKLIAGSMLAG